MIRIWHVWIIIFLATSAYGREGMIDSIVGIWGIDVPRVINGLKDAHDVEVDDDLEIVVSRLQSMWFSVTPNVLEISGNQTSYTISNEKPSCVELEYGNSEYISFANDGQLYVTTARCGREHQIGQRWYLVSR